MNPPADVGLFADRVLGQRRTVVVGGIFMAAVYTHTRAPYYFN